MDGDEAIIKDQTPALGWKEGDWDYPTKK